MKHSSRRRRAALVWLSLAAVTTAACGSQGEEGVGVKGVDADIAFGIKKPDPEKTSVVDIQTPVPVETTDPEQEVALEPLGPPTRRRLGPGLRPTSSCPKASPNAFAEVPADTFVRELPRPGQYRWKRGGYQELAVVPGQQLPIGGFERRVISDVTKVSETTNPVNNNPDMHFTYKVTSPYGSDHVIISTYSVKTNVAGQREVNVQTGARARTGPPDRGVVLTRVTIADKRGVVEEERSYNPGLLLLPLPVSPGETFTSTAVQQPDRSGRTGSINLQGKVLPRERVDACGQLVEGWVVEATMQGEDGVADTQRYMFATQYGAMMIYEKHDYRTGADHYAPEYSLAQRDPTPLEQEAS